jgi:hypothetical protein
VHRYLPEDHLSDSSRDSVKLAMGLVATMPALVLGLLVSSAKDAYDTKRSEVIQMAAKVAFLHRVLALYGPEAAAARTELRAAVTDAVQRIWPTDRSRPGQLALNEQAGDTVYVAIQGLLPHDDTQRALKTQIANLMVDLGQLRALLIAQSVPSISKPMAHHPCLVARGDFFRLQSDCPAQCHDHASAGRLCVLSCVRNFFDS